MKFFDVSNLADLLTSRAHWKSLPSCPADQFLFDHVPRTGGTYFAAILSQIVGSTSENIDCGPDYPEFYADEIDRLDQFQVVVGHLRLDTINAFRRIRPRRLISIVRDPASQIESTYKFWRNNITQDLPNCNFAKKLTFSEFIREPELRMAVDNPMTRHFFGLWNLETMDQSATSRVMAVRMSESYSFIGVTERMDETVAAFSKMFPTNNRVPRTKKIDRNASLGTSTMSSRDFEFLREHNQLDYAIYSHVNETLDEILYGSLVKDTESRVLSCDYSDRIDLK